MVPACHRILLVDDDFDQQFLSARALTKALDDHSTIHLASTGSEAIAYMVGEGDYADRRRYPFPTVVITDLKMHDGDGFDVLEFMRANPAWCVVPRIVLTTSDYADDIRTAYQLGASAYHVKPGTLVETERQMAQIIAYWSTIHVPRTDTTGRVARTSSSTQLSQRFPPADGGAHMERPHDHAHR